MAVIKAVLLFILSVSVLAEDDNLLPEVKVREYPLITNDTHGSAGLKSRIAGNELPITLEGINRELINNSLLPNMNTLLENYSLTNMAPDEGGFVGEVSIRGFPDNTFYRNGVNNSLGTLPLRELSNIESIEILKGPVSALYGPGEPGGSINYTTKKPVFDPFNEITLSTGSYDTYRAELDTSAGLIDDTLAYRLITAIESTGSFRETVETDRIFASPSLIWNITSDLSLLAEVEYIQHKAPFDSGVLADEDTFSTRK